ncbi:MAG: PHP domain-containing protein [Eubacteriaceae bacterium]|nr:PHP domain-containing protein [Eubacteriaceae bacterium]
MVPYKFSYHNHTDFSDGKATPEEMASEAFRRRYTHFAITDHLYVPTQNQTLQPAQFENYLSAIRSIRAGFSGEMKVLAGIEADFFKNAPRRTRLEEIRGKLDIVLGSVHILENEGGSMSVDEAADGGVAFLRGVKALYGGDIWAALDDYFDCYLQMIASVKPDIAAHPDLIRIQNHDGSLFDESSPRYIKKIEAVAEELAKADIATEINGGGNDRYKNSVYYPSDRFLNILREYGVAVTVGLDAHDLSGVEGYFYTSVMKLKAAGFTEAAYFEGGQRKSVAISEIMKAGVIK